MRILRENISKIYFILTLLLLISNRANADEIVNIISVSDGDTIKILYENEKQAVRLLDIDCFETSKNRRAIKQSEYYHISIGEVIKRGMYSKEMLTNLLKKQSKVILSYEKYDRYHRILGNVSTLDGININEYMKKSGGCNEYVEFSYKN